MRSFLLAAGKGTRLLPLTLEIPKCLVNIDKKPLLSYWLDLFHKHRISKVYINSNHLHEKVVEFLKTVEAKVDIELCYEEKLLGSLGTLVVNKSEVMLESQILVCYADNLTNVDFSKFIEFHKSHKYPISIGLFEAQNPQECGILELDKDDIVVSFIEKPIVPKSNLANAGIYIFDTRILEDIQYNGKLLDIAYDLLPKFINNMKGYKISEFIYDIGDLNKLEFAHDYLMNHKEEF